MSKLVFEPSDFHPPDEPGALWLEQICEKAQAKFQKWLSEQEVHFGWRVRKDKLIWHPDKACYDDNPTHTARLVCIEPIAAKECIEHEPDYEQLHAICIKCGIKLKATWEPA